jgi:hypothetical protein
MIEQRAVRRAAVLILGLILGAAASASGAPGYYVTELAGRSYTYPPTATTNADGESLLANGTVIGETIGNTATSGGLANSYLSSWNSSGIRTDVYYTFNLVSNVWGDNAGQFVANQADTVYVWNGTTYAATGNANLSGTTPYGMSQGGLVFGGNEAATKSWAYDLNTSTYYSFASGTNSWANGANAAGYVVGTNNGTGYVWQESNQSYSTIGSLESANGISSNSQYVAGESTAGNAAVYTPSGSPVGAYWTGEATFVNDGGLVVGDTTSADLSGADDGRAMAHFPGYGGQTVDLTSAYAPAGVTFNFAAGLNDAGQILVWSGVDPIDFAVGTSYLLTPALPGDADLDGKVDINDLTVVLSHFGRTGATWSTGDFTGDGTVDVNDLTIVLSHFGQTAGAAAAAMAAVPEPGAVMLLAAALIGLLATQLSTRRKK